jgi:crossover junction endodeoxyribonuclease RuvC
MVILGIDPGFATIGYGVLSYEHGKFHTINYGAITTAPGRPLYVRLQEIYQDMMKLIDLFQPDEMSVEELFFNTNVTTGIQVAHARGIILLAAAQKNVKIAEYTPLQVKQAVVGYGRAEKKQVMEMTKMILGLEKIPRPDDAADALALAICHGHAGNLKLR